MTSTTDHRSGHRRPFDSINTNTITASLAKVTRSASAYRSNGNTLDTEKRIGKRGGLLSRSSKLCAMLTTGKVGSKKETSESNEIVVVKSAIEPLTLRGVSLTNPVAIPELAPYESQLGFNSENVRAIFRQPSLASVNHDLSFWNDETEMLLSLKPANPVLNDSRDDEDSILIAFGESENREENNYCEHIRNSLTTNIDNEAGYPLFYFNRLMESDNDGFKIAV